MASNARETQVANKDLMRRYLQTWAQGNLDALETMLASNVVNHNLVTGEARSIAFEKEACRLWHDGFSDTHIHIQHMVAEEDHITVQWQMTATHTGEFLGVEATGNQITVPGMEINRIVDGQIAEIWRLSDTTATMLQLGMTTIATA